jgi:hypothetical protein
VYGFVMAAVYKRRKKNGAAGKYDGKSFFDTFRKIPSG